MAGLLKSRSERRPFHSERQSLRSRQLIPSGNMSERASQGTAGCDIDDLQADAPSQRRPLAVDDDITASPAVSLRRENRAVGLVTSTKFGDRSAAAYRRMPTTLSPCRLGVVEIESGCGWLRH